MEREKEPMKELDAPKPAGGAAPENAALRATNVRQEDEIEH